MLFCITGYVSKRLCSLVSEANMHVGHPCSGPTVHIPKSPSPKLAHRRDRGHSWRRRPYCPHTASRRKCIHHPELESLSSIFILCLHSLRKQAQTTCTSESFPHLKVTLRTFLHSNSPIPSSLYMEWSRIFPLDLSL